jgi:hypothetical protein
MTCLPFGSKKKSRSRNQRQKKRQLNAEVTLRQLDYLGLGDENGIKSDSYSRQIQNILSEHPTKQQKE